MYIHILDNNFFIGQIYLQLHFFYGFSSLLCNRSFSWFYGQYFIQYIVEHIINIDSLFMIYCTLVIYLLTLSIVHCPFRFSYKSGKYSPFHAAMPFFSARTHSLKNCSEL